MSRVLNEAGNSKFGDSTEFASPPLKKHKTDTDPDSEAKVDAEVKPENRFLRRGNWDDPEYARQRMIFEDQFKKSEMNNEELMKLLIKTAIDEENEDNGTELKLVKYVSANVLAVQGYLFFITFWAEDLSSPNPEPQCYQAKVRKFADEIDVSQFRLRPTQD